VAHVTAGRRAAKRRVFRVAVRTTARILEAAGQLALAVTLPAFDPRAFVFVVLLAWYGLLERMLRGPYLQSMPELIRRAVRWLWLLVAIAGFVVVLTPQLAGIVNTGVILNSGLLVLGLLAAVLAAQLYGEATIEPHAALRGFCLAAAVFAGSQSYLFAVTLLLDQLPAWLPLLRNIANLVSLGVLAWCLQSNPQWSLAIFVSPQARVYAPRLLAAFAALLLIILAMPLYDAADAAPGDRFTAPLYVALLGALLTVVLFSERLRAQLRVFVSKHFLPFRYDYREEWLRLIDTLASPGQDEPLPERAIRCLAQIVSSPAGLLWMRESDTGPFHIVEAWNTQRPADGTVAPDDPVVLFMHERQWILDTAELQRRPELYPGLQRPSWLAVLPDGLLIVPLISNETTIGFVVLFQSSSAFRLTFEEIDLLRTSGRQIAAYLAQYQADQQLAEAQQFEAFNRLTAFVMHDLKNLIAQQSLVVRNAGRHKGNPKFFEDAIATIDNSVARMNRLLKQLQSGESAGPRQAVRLVDAVKDALARCSGRRPEPELVVPDESLVANLERERFVTVLSHLIRNAQEASADNGSVRVELQRRGEHAEIVIVDDGEGMEPDFLRNRLFRPFDSTKGSKGMGIGAYQARAFIVGSGGSLDVWSEPGRGSRFTITLPARVSESAAAVSV